MSLPKPTIATAPGVDTVDLCARSGLNSPATRWATVYTNNFDRVRDFYGDLLGADSKRFEADDMAAYHLGDGSQLLVQSVDEGSPLSRLAGSQSVSLTRDPAEAEPLKARLDTVEVEDGPAQWDEDVVVGRDPDGNLIQVAFVNGNGNGNGSH
jgi:catechol 2,3-dioxygenase-like lactoylglutathione lyase family enzyme